MGVQLIGYIEAETIKSWLFRDHFWEHPDWVPKSQSGIIRSDETHEVVLTLSDWISGKKELKEFTHRDVPLPEEFGGPPASV